MQTAHDGVYSDPAGICGSRLNADEVLSITYIFNNTANINVIKMMTVCYARVCRFGFIFCLVLQPSAGRLSCGGHSAARPGWERAVPIAACERDRRLRARRSESRERSPNARRRETALRTPRPQTASGRLRAESSIQPERSTQRSMEFSFGLGSSRDSVLRRSWNRSRNRNIII